VCSISQTLTRLDASLSATCLGADYAQPHTDHPDQQCLRHSRVWLLRAAGQLCSKWLHSGYHQVCNAVNIAFPGNLLGQDTTYTYQIQLVSGVDTGWYSTKPFVHMCLPSGATRVQPWYCLPGLQQACRHTANTCRHSDGITTPKGHSTLPSSAHDTSAVPSAAAYSHPCFIVQYSVL
jgi:hypothetical protein